MGGFDGQNFLAIVEVYDPELNAWIEGTPLTTGRSGHASAVIYQPSCVTTYMDCLESTSDQNSDGGMGGPTNDDADTGHSNGGGGTSGSSGNNILEIAGRHCNHCKDNANPDTGQDSSSPMNQDCFDLENRPTSPCSSLHNFDQLFLDTSNNNNNNNSYSNHFNSNMDGGESSSSGGACNRSVVNKTDKKRLRVHSFDSFDAIPSKIPIMNEESSLDLVACGTTDESTRFKRIFGRRQCNSDCSVKALKNSLKQSFRDFVSPRDKSNKYCKFRGKKS